MTESTTQPPAQDAIASAQTTALPTQDPIDPAYFVPQATRENYLAIVRDQAAVRGDEPSAVRDEMVAQFEQQHQQQPLDGYDHLAAWLKSVDLGASTGPTGMQVLIARTLESARRDPQQAVVGDQALVEIGVAAQVHADEQVAAAAVSPIVDTTSGVLPNPGPLPIPEGTTAVDPAVAEQQAAALAQLDQTGKLKDEEAGKTPPPSTEPTPPAAPTSTKTSGKTSGPESSGS